MSQLPFRSSKNHNFTDEQKWALLLEYDKCLDRGSKAAFLRRVGIVRDTIWKWSKAREEGRLTDPATRSRPAKQGAMSQREAEYWKRRAERAEKELARTQAANEILGKAAALLEELSKSAAPEPEPTQPPGMPHWLADPSGKALPQIPSAGSRKQGPASSPDAD